MAKKPKIGWSVPFLFESRCLNVFPAERKHKLHKQTHYFCARPRSINAPLFTVMLTATRSKGTLFYRCLDKIVYAQFPSCGSIHNSSWRAVSRLTAAAQRDANANPRAPAHRGSSVVIPLPLSARRQKGKKPFRSLRNLKSDLDLNVEGDLSIVMAFAEKLRAGLHSFVFGKPFHTSVQEKEVLVSFWPLLPLFPLHFMSDGRCCIVLVLRERLHMFMSRERCQMLEYFFFAGVKERKL